VSPSGDVFEFEFIYGKGDIKTSTRTGVIANWERHTETWRDRPYRTQVEAALHLLGWSA
jgi:hypothetical protein